MSTLLQMTVQGRGAIPINDGSLAPDRFLYGVPLEANGDVSVDDLGVVDYYHQGLPFTAVGRLAVDLSAEVIDHYGQGLAPFTSVSRLLMSNDAVDRVENGIPFAVSGALVYIVTTNIFTNDFAVEFY